MKEIESRMEKPKQCCKCHKKLNSEKGILYCDNCKRVDLPREEDVQLVKKDYQSLCEEISAFMKKYNDDSTFYRIMQSKINHDFLSEQDNCLSEALVRYNDSKIKIDFFLAQGDSLVSLESELFIFFHSASEIKKSDYYKKWKETAHV